MFTTTTAAVATMLRATFAAMNLPGNVVEDADEGMVYADDETFSIQLVNEGEHQAFIVSKAGWDGDVVELATVYNGWQAINAVAVAQFQATLEARQEGMAWPGEREHEEAAMAARDAARDAENGTIPAGVTVFFQEVEPQPASWFVPAGQRVYLDTAATLARLDEQGTTVWDMTPEPGCHID